MLDSSNFDNRAAYWADRIGTLWRDTVEGILDVGRTLIDAREEYKTAERPFSDLIGDSEGKPSQLLLNSRACYKLISIASDERIVSHAAQMPPSWETLYALTRLSAERFAELLESGVINPGMMRKDLKQAEKAERVERRTVRERELGEEMPEGEFGVIYADPEWRFEPYSRETGMDRAADQHYSTSPTDVIASRDVASIAAKDCVLFLWATVPMLPDAMRVGQAWGFTYKSHCIWLKEDAVGTGYWFRNCHELLLVFTKGDSPAPAPGEQWASVISAPIGEHSAKPEIFLEMIEHLYPTVPKIELNRRGPARPGWSAWGYEAAIGEADRVEEDASAINNP